MKIEFLRTSPACEIFVFSNVTAKKYGYGHGFKLIKESK